MKPTISVIGTGRMGSALTKALLKAGYDTHIWNRSAAKYAPLVELGAIGAATVLEAIADADIVIVNVSNYAATNHLLDTDAVTAALAGKLIVQLSAGSPQQARDSATWAAKHGAHYLDGMILGTPDIMSTADGTIIYSGPKDLFERHKDVLLALGSGSQHVGTDFGHASALDLALMGQLWGALYGSLWAAVITEREGIPKEQFLAHLETIKPVVDHGVLDVAKRVRDGRLAGDKDTMVTIDVHNGALQAMLELCKDGGIDRTFPNALNTIFSAAVETGRGQDDFAALSLFLQDATHVPPAKVAKS